MELSHQPPPPKPPFPSSSIPPTSLPRSFRDATASQAAAEHVFFDEDDEMDFSEEDFIISSDEDGPSIVTSEAFNNRTSQEWASSIIVKLWGREIGFRSLCEKLKSIWPTAGTYTVIDLDLNFFLIKFDDPADYETSLSRGPWLMFGHYLTVEPWRPGFRPELHRLGSTVVWVRFPGLPCEFYKRRFLRVLGNVIGPVVKLDSETAKGTRGLFARIALLLDLSKPLVSKIRINGAWQRVVYEGLPAICASCKRASHSTSACPDAPPHQPSGSPLSQPSSTAHLSRESGSPPAPSTAALGAHPSDDWVSVGSRRRHRPSPARLNPSASAFAPTGQIHQSMSRQPTGVSTASANSILNSSGLGRGPPPLSSPTLPCQNIDSVDVGRSSKPMLFQKTSQVDGSSSSQPCPSPPDSDHPLAGQRLKKAKPASSKPALPPRSPIVKLSRQKNKSRPHRPLIFDHGSTVSPDLENVPSPPPSATHMMSPLPPPPPSDHFTFPPLPSSRSTSTPLSSATTVHTTPPASLPSTSTPAPTPSLGPGPWAPSFVAQMQAPTGSASSGHVNHPPTGSSSGHLVYEPGYIAGNGIDDPFASSSPA